MIVDQAAERGTLNTRDIRDALKLLFGLALLVWIVVVSVEGLF